MSTHDAASGFAFYLDDEPLNALYDAEVDILMLWFGDEMRPSYAVDLLPGVHAQLDMSTNELVGFEIHNWAHSWRGRDIPVMIPLTGHSVTREQHELRSLACA